MEIWKDIPWYEWKYQASTLGVIKSLLKRQWKKWSRILKINQNNRWYSYVDLYIDWKKKKLLVHRLVLISFKWENNELQVNHIDWDKTNNRLENLEWCTKSENELHKYKILGYVSPMKWRLWKDNPLYWKWKSIAQYTKDWELIKEWNCIADINRVKWYNSSSISNNALWRSKTSYWFKWKFIY